MARPADPTLRRRLIEAATGLFAEQGFADASMEAVGAATRVSKGGVYFHFRTKEELFFAVVDHWRSDLRAALPPADAPSESAATTLERTVAAWLAFHFERPAAARVLRVLAAELRGRFTAALRGDAREEQRALRARLRQILTRGSRDGTLYAGDPVLAAFLVAGSAEGFVGQWLTSPQDAEPFCDAAVLAEAISAPYVTGVLSRPPADGDAGSEFRPPF